MLDSPSRSITSSDFERTASIHLAEVHSRRRTLFSLTDSSSVLSKTRMMAATATLLSVPVADAKNPLVSHSIEMTKRKNQENLLSTIKKQPVHFLSASPQQLPVMSAFETETDVSTSDAWTHSTDRRQRWVFFNETFSNKDRQCSFLSPNMYIVQE